MLLSVKRNYGRFRDPGDCKLKEVCSEESATVFPPLLKRNAEELGVLAPKEEGIMDKNCLQRCETSRLMIPFFVLSRSGVLAEVGELFSLV